MKKSEKQMLADLLDGAGFFKRAFIFFVLILATPVILLLGVYGFIHGMITELRKG